MFFDRHARFTETSNTGSTAARLNRRHAAIVGWSRPWFEGARVLDIASHDGRWSAAALEAGAAHVTAVEARPHLVANARETFRHYGLPADRYELRAGDVFAELGAATIKADLVLLLGFFYHVSNHVELARLISDTGARTVIVDTNIVADRDVPAAWPSMIGLRPERIEHEWNRFTSDAENAEVAVVGLPSRGAVAHIFEHFGFQLEEYDWAVDLASNGAPADLYDYVAGERATFRLTRQG